MEGLYCRNLFQMRENEAAREGYYEDIEKQPSIISITSLAASIALNKFLSLFGVFGEEYFSRTQVEVKNEFMISDSPEIKSGCICQKRRGLGDSRKIIYTRDVRRRSTEKRLFTFSYGLILRAFGILIYRLSIKGKWGIYKRALLHTLPNSTFTRENQPI